MRLGVSLPSYANDGMRIPPDRLARFAARAEELGFAGVWITEHLRRPPGREYSRLDPLTTLATVAGATETIPIGTSIMILPMRHPVMVAKRAATIQHLAADRLTLGLGLGWVEAEYDAVGVPFRERGPRFTEGLELLSRLFAEDVVTFDGEFYSVDDFRLEPSVSRRPPILVGGGSVEGDGERFVPEPVKDRIHTYGDGWIAATRHPDDLAETWREIADHVAANGRDPTLLEKVALNFIHMIPNVDTEAALRRQRKAFKGKGDVEQALDSSLTGSVEDIRQLVAQYEAQDYDELILGTRTHDLREIDRQLELWADRLSSFM
ncbi:MAG: LLM class flavin-dependent oxidoreductase [Halobacteriales archaeon]